NDPVLLDLSDLDEGEAVFTHRPHADWRRADAELEKRLVVGWNGVSLVKVRRVGECRSPVVLDQERDRREGFEPLDEVDRRPPVTDLAVPQRLRDVVRVAAVWFLKRLAVAGLHDLAKLLDQLQRDFILPNLGLGDDLLKSGNEVRAYFVVTKRGS